MGDIKTPRGKITLNAKGTKAVLEWNDHISRFAKQGTRAQKWLDNRVLVDTAPFVPMQTGMLMKSGQLGTIVGSGTVVYQAPYARYLYYGKLWVDPATGSSWATTSGYKVATDKDLVFSQSVHPQAQAFWFEASKAQNKPKWIAGARKLAGGG